MRSFWDKARLTAILVRTLVLSGTFRHPSKGQRRKGATA